MKLTNNCPQCGKKLELVNQLRLPLEPPTDYRPINFYKCGHCYIGEDIVKREIKFTTAFTDKVARPYQIEGVEFFNDSGFNAAITDEMGVGKTAQAWLALRNNPQLGPTLIIVKSAITYQWQQAGKEWFSPEIMGSYIISGVKGMIPSGFSSYIISMDTFSRMVKFENITTQATDRWGHKFSKIEEIPVVQQNLKSLGIKFLIVDECHSFKDPSSMRTKALVGFCKAQDIKHRLFLSGTPIKNRADEYFTTLNLLRPEEFPSLDEFRSKWLMRDSTGKYSRINRYLESDFRELISKFVIRREKSDVQMDLPDFAREFTVIEVPNEKIKAVYNQEVDRLRVLQAEKGGDLSYIEASDSLMTLRRLTGMMKIEWAVDKVEEFLESCEGEKIAIGVHHHLVRDGIYGMLKLKGHNVLKLSGEDNVEAKEEIKHQFGMPDNRILVINMLAGGVGMDGLQICNNVLVLERQWSSADEEQFEARFHRSGQILKVMADYPIVRGTVDEFFARMVEEKRFIFGKTVSNDWSLMGDASMWKELVNSIIGGRL